MKRSRALILAVALGAACVPAPCRADTPAETPEIARARESFDRGLELFERGEHRAALAEFERAHDLAPSFRIFYNIGLVNVALGDAAAALSAFQRYLREGQARVPVERREEVEREIAKLSQRAAALIIDVDRAQAAIAVDGKPLGTSPLAGRIWLNPGRHRVSVESGGKRREQEVELAAGDDRVLRLELDEQAPSTPPAPSPAPAPQAEQPADQGGESRVPWLAWGVTGALAVGTGVTGGLALSAHGEEQELQQKDGVTKSELEDARSNVERWALVSDVLLAATVVSAGVSLYLTLEPSEDESAPAALIVAPNGIAARYRF